MFNLVHLSPKTAKVVLVPTAENLSIDTDRVKAIYSKIGVTLDITWAAPFDITPYLTNGVLETKDVFGDLTDYSLSQQKIINAYKATGKVANDTYYVFITNAKSSTGQGGYMALGGQFGFVFDQTARTLAHELGHGIFKLAHPFKKKQQGNVPSLMDYTSDEDLLFADWKQINDPAFKVGIFQGQSEGEYNANAHLGLTPDGVVFDTFFFKGKKINTTIEVAPDKYTIQKISYQGNQYYWDKQSKAFVGTEGAIKVKREAKNINNKVNIYRSRKDGCTYDYLTIPWETKDEQSTNIVQTIEKYIAQYNESYWRIAPYTVRDASCGKEFFTHLRERDLQECSTAEINEGRKILQGLLAEANSERVTSIVNSYCMAAISGLTYGEIEKLFDIIASQERITEHSEVALLRLMSGIKTTDYKRFYAHLEANGNKLLKHLIEEIDDASVNFLTDKKNYTNFIGALVWMFNHNPASIEDRWGKNEEDFAKRTLNLNPISYSEYSSFMYSTSTSKKNEGEYVSATGNIKLYDVYTIKSPKTVLVKGDVPIDLVEQKEPITEVSPLTPLIIVPDKDKLPLMKTALEGNDLGNEVYIVPAIFLKYGNDKIRNDYIEKGVITTLDVATIALSGGTALATKVHWVRRAWALAEVVGAVGDIGVNVSQHIDPHSSLGQVVNSYNLAMGVIGIKNLGQAGYKFAKNLPQATKELLQKNGNLRTKLISYYQKWQTEVAQLDNPSQAEKQLVEKQAEVWKALGFENKIDDILLNAKWVDDLETVIGINVKNKIKEWVREGLNYSKLESSFNKSSNKLELFSKLEKAKSLNHQKVIIGDYENILGVTKGEYISNSVDNIKSDIKIKVNNNDFVLKKYQGETFAKNAKLIKRENIEVIEDLGNGIQFIKIKPGTKLYRVFDGYKPWDDISQTGNTLPKGNYWTFDRPTSISEVIGGTAVMPEWNGMTKIIEIEAPSQGIYVWRGVAARQPASSVTKDFFLKGGIEQVIFDYKQNKINLSEITKSIKELK